MKHLYVITGGPSGGKTEVIKELAKRGHHTIPETVTLIEERGILPKNFISSVSEREFFQRKVAELQIDQESAVPENILAFSDRGLPDGLAYFRIDNVMPPSDLMTIYKQARYSGVFVLEPIPNYKKNSIRWESKERAEKMYKLILQVYKELGHKPVLVPVMPISSRASFIEKSVKS